DDPAAARPAGAFRGPCRVPGIGVLGDAPEAQGGGGVGDPRHAHRKDDDVAMQVWSRLDEAGRAAALARPTGRSDPGLRAKVAAIVDDVRVLGWQGLADWAVRIDGAAPRRVPV